MSFGSIFFWKNFLNLSPHGSQIPPSFFREKQEHDNYVCEASKQQLEEANEEAREEVTRQLNKAMIDDWDYQREFKRRQMDEENTREHLNALHDIKLNQQTLEDEAKKANKLEEQNNLDRKMELSNRGQFSNVDYFSSFGYILDNFGRTLGSLWAYFGINSGSL